MTQNLVKAPGVVGGGGNCVYVCLYLFLFIYLTVIINSKSVSHIDLSPREKNSEFTKD
jgi:hypothetical protein